MTPQQENTTCVCGKADCGVPFGFCHCGCKNLTKICPHTDKRHGAIKGKPLIFITGHNARLRRVIPVIENAKPFKIDGVYCRLIPLTQGQYAIVWESDYEWLMEWKWCAWLNPDTKTYYALRNSPMVDGRSHIIHMHRFILGLEYGNPSKGDHKSGVTLDNRRANLRNADNSESSANTKKLRKNNTSGYRGVCWDKKRQKWFAQIDWRRKHYNLGYFDTKEEAYAAYCEAASRLHGEFARAA